jgi:uncharacterized membrane protein
MRLARRDRADHHEQAPVPETPPDETGSAGRRRTLRATRTPAPEAAAPAQHPPADAPSGTGEAHHQPAPEGPKSSKGRIRALFDEQVAQSREEAEREAATELRQFMEPARQQLLLNVPGSSSPEEAESMLTSQAASVLSRPVEVSPDTVVDLRNPSSMGAYPPAEKLSNRVLRLADRHWAKGQARTSAEIVAEKSAIADREFARKPAGTQRCLALRGSLRCRGVFVYHADDMANGSPVACPTCGATHTWDLDGQAWMLGPEVALREGRRRSALTSPT